MDERKFGPKPSDTLPNQAATDSQSLLNPNFSEGTLIIENSYTIDVPQEVVDLCTALEAIGGKALLVGGSVRDAVLSAEFPDTAAQPKDFDIEVFGLDVDTLQAHLERTYGAEKVDTVGKAFAVIKVYIPGFKEPLDVSIPRRDSKVGDAHNEFVVEGVPSMTILEAAKRRDLTINALSYDPLTQVLYDPVGGVADIQQGRIRITDAETFQEDPLRVLRVMQFAARFGFNVEKVTQQLCQEMIRRGDLDHLKAEGITEELKKLLLKGKKPSIGLNFAKEIGATERYWPELHALIDVHQEPEWHPEGDVWNHTLQTVDVTVDVARRENLDDEQHLTLALAVLTHDFGKVSTTVLVDGRWKAHGHEAAGKEPAAAFLKRFKFSADIVKRVIVLVPEHMQLPLLWKQEAQQGITMDRALRKLAVRLSKGDSNIQMLSLVTEADQRGRNGKGSTPLQPQNTRNLLEMQAWLVERSQALEIATQPPECIVTGRMMLDILDIQKGSALIGIVLDYVYSKQLDGEIRSVEEGLEVGMAYYRELEQHVKDEVAGGRKEREVLKELRDSEVVKK